MFFTRASGLTDNDVEQVCQVLKKNENMIAMYHVKYAVLEKIRPLIEQARDIEKALHQKKQGEKSANWMLTAAKSAEIDLDEEVQLEISGKLGAKALGRDELKEAKRLEEFKHDDSLFRKRESKAKQKEQSLKLQYDKEIQAQKMKKFSNSSFLTPEAASYLNEAIRSNQSKVDDEVVYAGLHTENIEKKKFKRKEKYTSRFKKDRGQKRRKKGRFG